MVQKLLSFARQQVLGLIALFVALGGTSYAVATGSIDSREIKDGTIRSKDIRNGQVRSGDLKNNDVRSTDVRDRSLLSRDFKPGQLPPGPPGPKGDRGGSAPSDSYRRSSTVPDNAIGAPLLLEANSFGRLNLRCSDENGVAGNENPTMSVEFANTAPFPLNFARQLGTGAPVIGELPSGAVHTMAVPSADAYRLHLESSGVNALYEGFARQLGQGTPSGHCLLVGVVETIAPGG
jgi:hypothetical protein